jgi:hypothetical protein
MKTYSKILYWIPRILCIVAILFVSMFASDAFSPHNTIWQNIVSLFMHLLPSFILIVALVIAWKWELVGGIIVTIMGLAFGTWVFLLNLKRIHSVGKSLGLAAMICLPFVISGILFIVNHYSKKRNQTVFNK